MSITFGGLARWLCMACAFVAVGVCAQAGSPPPLSRADQAFVARATGDNAFQIALARRVLGQSPSQRSREFAQHGLDGHTRLNVELARLATQRATQGASPPSPVQATRDIDQHLAGLQGTALEQAFAGLMVRDHRGVLPVFEQEARAGDDPRLRAFAQSALPVLQGHLGMAEGLTRPSGDNAAEGQGLDDKRSENKGPPRGWKTADKPAADTR